jgi:hypothetical protein
MSTIEELLERKTSDSSLENEITAMRLHCSDYATPLYQEK